MMKRFVLAIILLAAVSPALQPSAAQELPPVTAGMNNTASILCLKVARSGDVAGAYILTGTGNAKTDADVLAWARALRWPAAGQNETGRDSWFPMPVAFGDITPPQPPAKCAAPE